MKSTAFSSHSIPKRATHSS